MKQKSKKWSVDNSAALYGIDKWGAGYFATNTTGDVVITPLGEDKGVRISLHEVAKGIEERGLDMPVLLRIENILGSQIRRLHDTFNNAIADSEMRIPSYTISGCSSMTRWSEVR